MKHTRIVHPLLLCHVSIYTSYNGAYGVQGEEEEDEYDCSDSKRDIFPRLTSV
jgi:hypothetical protein